MKFLKGLRYSYLIFSNFFSIKNPHFKRLPEPSAITDGQAFVDDYNRASQSVMMLPYVLVLNMISRIQGHRSNSRVIDLCCGPAHFSRLLARQNFVEEVTGVDLSEPMLSYARENAKKENLSLKMNFIKNDVTKLDVFQDHVADVTTFLNGAHHLNSLGEVTKVLKEAERITKADGLILILDPVRQKNKKVSDLYYSLSGEDYVKKGMKFFNKDFYDSILASWTPEEFVHCVPEDTQREWVHIVPFGVPTFQILVGLPSGQKELFKSKGLPDSYLRSLIPRESLLDWAMFNFSFSFASITRILKFKKVG